MSNLGAKDAQTFCLQKVFFFNKIRLNSCSQEVPQTFSSTIFHVFLPQREVSESQETSLPHLMEDGSATFPRPRGLKLEG
jgi:hypothetical protein